MPFIPAAAIAIGSAVSAGVATAAAVAAPTIAAIGSAAAAVGGTLYSVAKTVAGAVGTAAKAVGSFAGGAGGTIGNLISDVGGVFKSFVDPVVKVFTEIKDFVSTINTNFIVPVRDMYVGTLDAWTSLKSALAGDVHAGIAGFLKIPGDLADAMTSVDAQFARATERLGSANKQIVDESLVPGLTKGIGAHLDRIGDGLVGLGSQEYTGVGLEGKVSLSPETSADDALALWQNFIEANQKATGIFGTFFKFIGNLFTVLPAFEASMHPRLERVRQDANQKFPETPLDAGDALEAYYRGIITEPALVAELTRSGWDATRIQTLIENRQWLPGLGDLVWMVARGVIANTDATKIAEKLHLTETDWNAYFTAAYETPDAVQARRAEARLKAANNGWLPLSLTDPVPDTFTQLEQARRRNGNVALVDWVNAAEIPGLEWWITRYIRGIGSLDDVYKAAEARLMPPELLPDLVPIFQETVQLWMIPDMIATNIMTDQEALSYLHYIGIGERDAALILKYGDAKRKAPASGVAADLAKISAAQAKTMYEDGTINDTTYVDILIEHGYSKDAADLTLSLTQTELAIKARKAEATSLVDQVDLGVITETTAVDELYKLGYTTDEVYVWVKKMKASKVAKSKTLSMSDLKDALMYGAIDATTWAQRVEALGYSAADTQILFTIFVEQHGQPPKPG